MASSLASVTVEQILSINEAAVPNNTKMATKLGLTVFNGELFNLSKLKISWAGDDQILLCAFAAVLLEINQIFDRLIIQLV